MEGAESLSSKLSTKEAGLRKSAEHYERAANTLALIAKEVSGLSVPEKTIEDWKTLLVSIRVVDNKLDHIGESEKRKDFENQIISFLKGENVDFSNDKDLEGSMYAVRTLAEKLDERQRSFFIASLFRLLNLSEKIKSEEKANKLVDLTRLEGQTTFKVFLPFLPEEFRQSDKYPKLIRALTRFARAANTFDTFIDLPTDHKNKQVKIEPNLRNRVLFLGSVITDSLAVLKETGMSADLAKSILANIKYTAQNSSEKDK